jgi:hypothetical protein
LRRVAETPELILDRRAVAKLMPRPGGMLEARVCHLHHRSERNKHSVSVLAAAYVKEQDIPSVHPIHEDPSPHNLGVSVADIKHALLPRTGTELPPQRDRVTLLKVVVGRDELSLCFTLILSLQDRVHG